MAFGEGISLSGAAAIADQSCLIDERRGGWICNFFSRPGEGWSLPADSASVHPWRAFCRV